jgi:hypothetical protein
MPDLILNFGKLLKGSKTQSGAPKNIKFLLKFKGPQNEI